MFCHLYLFFFFWPLRACYVKGPSLRCSPGRGNAGGCAMTLYIGEGLRESNGAHSTLHGISDTPSATHNQIGPLWCWFPSGWTCAHSRPQWVSPMTSPVRLGVSPAAASTPTGVFNQRFEALFPGAGALGCVVCFASPPFIPVYLCANVGPQGATHYSACPVLRRSESDPLGLSVHECGAAGSASGQTACPVHPTLRQSRSHHGHMSPLHPGAHLCPSYWSGCMFLFYLLGVRLPCRSIFCQFWLCEEAQCVYLCRHLGSPILFYFLFLFNYSCMPFLPILHPTTTETTSLPHFHPPP